MTAVMSPVNHRDPIFRDRESASEVYSPGFRAVNGRTSPSQAAPSNRASGSNAHASNGQQRGQPRPESGHSNNHYRSHNRPRDIDSRAAQRTDSLRTSPAQSSPLMSPAKRKRIASDVEADGSAKMVLLPSSRTGTNTSNTTTNTAVTARATPPRQFDDVDPLGTEAEQAEQSLDEDMESADDNEQGSIGPDHDVHERSWHGRDERERYRSHAGSDEHAESQAGRLSRATTSTTTNGQDHNSASNLARRDTEVSEVTAAGVQVLNPKKRKRVFSNRTKTGCQTCRKRKKKCDEQKPECGNCIRGSFVCEGYITKATWTKPSSNKAPVRLQSKNGYAETSPTYPGGAPPRDHYEPAQNVHPKIVAAEEPPHSAGWQKRPTWSEPQHPHYASEQPPPRNDFDRAATMPDVSRHDQRMSDYPPIPHHRMSQSYRTSPPQSINTVQPAVTAQLALQYQNGHRPSSSLSGPSQPTPTQRMSEKEKMLHGYPYQPYCQELEEDRDVCKSNVWRFNEVNNPMKLISKAEREIKFRAILETGMSRNLIGQPGSGSNSNSRLGRDVRVEAPFACEFGYNIDVHDDVVISRNCSIMDAARVILRAGAFLHPNVSIFTANMSTNPNLRDPRQREFQGRPVTIGENVVIGNNVVINPGVAIGKNTTIYAGSVVEDDIPSDVVVAGNPAKILGGVPNSPPAPQQRMIEHYAHPQHHAPPSAAASGPPPPPPAAAAHHGHHGSHGSHGGYLPDAYGPPPQAGPPPHTPSHIPHQHQHQPPHNAPPHPQAPMDPQYARSSIGGVDAGAYVPAEQHPHGHQQHQQQHQLQYAHHQHPPQHPPQYHDDASGGSAGGHGSSGARYYEGQPKGLRPVHPRPSLRV